MTRDMIGRRLQAMDLFAASFQANENGDDLSQAAREVGEQELANRSWPKDAENALLGHPLRNIID